MRLRTSSGIVDVVSAGSIWYSGKGIHSLKLPGNMSETSRTLQIFLRLTCATVESGTERDVKAGECRSGVSGPRVRSHGDGFGSGEQFGRLGR